MSICGIGIETRSFPLLPDQLALRDVLAEVLPDLAADDLPEAAVILVDLQRHAVSLANRTRPVTQSIARRGRPSDGSVSRVSTITQNAAKAAQARLHSGGQPSARDRPPISPP